MVAAGYFASGKMLGCGDGHSFPTIADFRNGRSYASATPLCVHGLDRDNLPLSLSPFFCLNIADIFSTSNFDVLLTVHLSIILVINQFNAQNVVL